jgi:hypothetical protein
MSEFREDVEVTVHLHRAEQLSLSEIAAALANTSS